MQRKDFFKNGIKDISKEILKSPLGSIVDHQLTALANLLSPEWLPDKVQQVPIDPDEDPMKALARNAPGPVIRMPRPPGALPKRAEFQKKCTQCNDCILACPHGAIISVGPFSGPVMDPNLFPCHLCEDYPCIKACETGALLPLPEDTIPKMGQAVLMEGHCRNYNRFSGKESAAEKKTACKECVTACPVPKAVKLNTKTKLPEFADHCAGCGLCVKACPAVPLALRVVY